MKFTTSSYFIGGLIGSTLLAQSDARAEDWEVDGSQVMYKNQPFLLKGINWFGAETCDHVPHGLWTHSMEWYLDFIRGNDFNALRLPISEELIVHSMDNVPNPGMVAADGTLAGKTSIQIIDAIFDQCAKRGIFILLDMHRLHCEAQSHELWYQDEYTYQTFIDSWQKVINRYANHPAFFGIDVLNEGRGPANFGADPSTSFNLLVDSLETALDYKGLVICEGVNWGHDLSGLQSYPLKMDPKRVIYSPHVYGPDVIGDWDTDTNHLRSTWDREFGFLADQGKAVITGEFGGKNQGPDHDWHEKTVDYFIEKNISGFYWCLNPDSGDTNGVLDASWTNPDEGKLELLRRLQPYPTFFQRRLLRTA
jgi:endoglucanase